MTLLTGQRWLARIRRRVEARRRGQVFCYTPDDWNDRVLEATWQKLNTLWHDLRRERKGL
jgi:hypothetical protein